MTRVIESIVVEVQCEITVVTTDSALTRCRRKADATIVATSNGDLVLVPIGWQIASVNSRLTIRCPDHKEK